MRTTLAVALVLVFACGPARAEERGTAALGGRVTDPLGSLIVGARVRASGPSGAKTTRTDGQGVYALQGLKPGTYTVTVTKDGFSPYTRDVVVLPTDHTTPLDVQLAVAPVTETVTVKEATPALSLAPEENAGAIVIKGRDLDALPDDPDEMMEALQALA
ncbi:MAG TPA: carboxypeptidase-like regulatory domain-containing protein, partial [Vicinamibacteria bacterium]